MADGRPTAHTDTEPSHRFEMLAEQPEQVRSRYRGMPRSEIYLYSITSGQGCMACLPCGVVQSPMREPKLRRPPSAHAESQLTVGAK